MIKEIAIIGAIGAASYVIYDRYVSGSWVWQKPPFVTSPTQQTQQLQLRNIIDQQRNTIVMLQQQQRLQQEKAQPMGRYGNPIQPGHTANYARGSAVY